MTPRQFWDGDCWLARDYRQAYEMKSDRQNEWLWLQGLYFYEAHRAVSESMFAKKGKKVRPYPEKPFDIKRDGAGSEPAEDKRAASVQEHKMSKGFAYMSAFMSANNKKFGSEVIGNTDH